MLHYSQEFGRSYFENLGCQVVANGQTNRSKLDAGIRTTLGEPCLPLKCYFGHVMSLLGKTDHIFVPRLVCPETNPGIRPGCPKLIGPPDMAKALVPEANVMIYEQE